MYLLDNAYTNFFQLLVLCYKLNNLILEITFFLFWLISLLKLLNTFLLNYFLYIEEVID